MHTKEKVAPVARAVRRCIRDFFSPDGKGTQILKSLAKNRIPVEQTAKELSEELVIPLDWALVSALE
jgi:hypothetical protein